MGSVASQKPWFQRRVIERKEYTGEHTRITYPPKALARKMRGAECS